MDWLSGGGGEKGPLCNNEATTCILAEPRDCTGEECGDLIPALVFPFMSLAFGMIIQPLAEMTRLPYTSLLLIVGGILGVLGCSVQMALLTESLQLWAHISPPTLFFYVFLAPLVFESAFNSDSHKFSKQIFQILIMAFLVVALQIFIVGAWQLYVIQSPDWTLLTALIFGSMLSATDPISVTATLKAVGASENLNILIEGESLLNDGSAFVFFEAFLEGATSPEGTTAGKVVLQVVRLSLGGMAMGIAFGLVAILFLSVVYEMFEVEVTITIVTAFLGFWTAQSPSILSGVICNVTAGLMLSGFGKQLISPGVREPMQKFWELLSWLANTIVFVYAGLLLVAYIWSCAGDPLEWYDYVHIISWYAFLNLLRFVLVYLVYPLCRLGQPWYTWREAFVVAFSGLRGAVTLILALEIGDNQQLPVSVRARTVVWSSAFVGLSLFINGTTIKSVLHMLGLDKPDPIKEEFLWRARAAMLSRTYEFLDAICVESTVKQCSWYYVTQSVVPHVWLSDLDKVSRAISNSLDMRSRDSILSSYRPSVESVRAGVRTSTIAGGRLSVTRESADVAGLKQRGRAPSLTAMVADDHRIDRPSREREVEMAGEHHDIAKDRRGERRTLEIHGGSQHGPAKNPEVSDAKLLDKIKELQPLVNGDVGTERDVQVRQRMLQSVLSIIRSAYEVSLVNYFHIAGLEDDIKKAMDANEEGEVYNLFWYLLDHEDSMVDWARPVDAIINQIIDQCLAAIFRLSGRGRLLSRGRIGTSSMIVHALRRVLLEPYLRDSELVVKEVKLKYEIFSAYLSKMEAAAPLAYSKVQTANIIKYVFQLQEDALGAMRQAGEVDTEEAEILHHELIQLQRKTIHRRVGKAGLPDDTQRRDRDILRGMPLFRPLDFETFVSSVLNRGEFLHLDMGEQAKGDTESIVVVLRGAVRIDRDSQRKCLIGKMGYNLNMGPQRGNDFAAEGAEEEVVELEMGMPMSACFGRHSVILPIDLFSSDVHEVPTASTCKTYGGATVFLLPISQALELAQLFDWFRAELARHVVRLTMFGFLQARGIWTQLVDHPDDNDPENTRITQAAVTAATHVIQTLPYSTLIGITKEDDSATIQGPGVLLQGRVRVRSRNLRALKDDSPHWDVYVAPAILPADVLEVELAEPADGDDAMNIAEIMVQELATEDVVAEDRIRRWNGPPELIEANGRFGLHKVFEFDQLVKQMQQEAGMDGEAHANGVNGKDDLKKQDGGDNGFKDHGET